MIRFGLACAVTSFLAFFFVLDMDWFPLVNYVIMPAADGSPVPVLTGSNTANLLVNAGISLVSGVIVAAALRIGYGWAAAYLPSRQQAVATEG